jgi:hypothetical protein|tara:strand:- start:111 stop:476 length:366 start_codon:yes stop_codon:yes gene_type:complete
MNPADHVYKYGYTPRELMEIDHLMNLVERIGLPAVIIGACMFYIWKTQLAHRQEISDWSAKDSKADERLIEVIKEQNQRNEHFATAISGLTVSNKDVVKSNERLANEIKGMAEALITQRRI